MDLFQWIDSSVASLLTQLYIRVVVLALSKIADCLHFFYLAQSYLSYDRAALIYFTLEIDTHPQTCNIG